MFFLRKSKTGAPLASPMVRNAPAPSVKEPGNGERSSWTFVRELFEHQKVAVHGCLLDA